MSDGFDEIIEYYDIHIAYIRHENDLFNHRTTWLFGIQSIVIAGFGFTFARYFESASNYIVGTPDSPMKHILEFLILSVVLIVFGVASARAGRRSIDAAITAQRTLEVHWKEKFSSCRSFHLLPDLMGGKSPEAMKRGPAFAADLNRIVLYFWYVAGASMLVFFVTFCLRLRGVGF